MLNRNPQSESEDTKSTNQVRICEFIDMVSSWVDPTVNRGDHGWRPRVGALPWQNPRVRTLLKSSMKSDYWIWINTGKLTLSRQSQDGQSQDGMRGFLWAVLLTIRHQRLNLWSAHRRAHLNFESDTAIGQTKKTLLALLQLQPTKNYKIVQLYCNTLLLRGLKIVYNTLFFSESTWRLVEPVRNPNREPAWGFCHYPCSKDV